MTSNAKNILEKTVHYLCVNSEALTFRGLKGKMTLIYFLFSYGKQFKKQHYVDFAFEVLEGYLTEVMLQFQTSKSNHSFDLCMLEVGWSLQKFVAMDFFESDDMEEILVPFDKMAREEAKILVSKQLSKENFITNILIANYLTDRIPAIEIDVPKSSTNRISLEQIITILNNSKSFLKEYPNHILLLNRFSNKTQCTYQMMLSLLFSKKALLSDKESKKMIFNELTCALGAAKNLLREETQQNYDALLLKIMLYGSFLLKNKTRNHQEFLTYCAFHLLK